MPVPELQVGPMEATDAAELVGDKGVHNQALELLKANAITNPPELAAAQLASYDEERTKALSLDDVAAAVDVPGKVVDASVRGLTEDERVIVYVYRVDGKPDGRTLKGMLPFSALSSGARASLTDLEDEDSEDEAGRLREENDDLRRRLALSEASVPPAGPTAGGSPHAATAADLSVPGVGASVPDDYDELNVEEVRALLDSSDPEACLAIVDYERQNKNRAGVVEYQAKADDEE